jgi:hypothetical protein
MYEGWSDITPGQYNNIKKNDCFKCYYGSRTTANKKALQYITCDYNDIEGKMRGCLPGECRENVKFIPRNQKGKRPKKALTL